jgi:ABC-type transport system substrate-binding protein
VLIHASGSRSQAMGSTAERAPQRPSWGMGDRHGGPTAGAKGVQELSALYPCDPETAKALLKEAGVEEQNPRQYALMTHAGGAALPPMAAIMKPQPGKVGVPLTVEGLDRPIDLPTRQQPRVRAAPQRLLPQA